MSADQQIREWARSEEIPVPARGRVPDELRARWAEAHPAEATGDNIGLSVVDLDELGRADAADTTSPGPQAPTEPFDTGETRPVAPGGGRFGRGSSRSAAPRPKAQHRRVSLEDLAADGWEAMAALVGSQGLTPTSRVLALQAPVAGMILEDTLRGTIVDRVLQPIARSGEKTRELAALIGPPLIVSVLTLKPELAPRLLPILRRQLRTWVLIAGPKLKAKERAEKKALAAMGVDTPAELDAEIDQMIASLWAPPEQLGSGGFTEMPDAA